jgi:phosphate starvation-inducible membrane PsiE
MEESGMDKEVKKYFRKILYSISWSLILLIAALTFGLYNKLAFTGKNPTLYNILFYFFFLAGLALLIRYLIKTWKNGGR